ncbi:MerR family transcriptional regulator [Isoptericola sp. NPDC057191]|uniref:MerR family transcriptional regulator n=1 Tax=Isoptericola sp. NPDC057191 TaxID=3346041 RepID=UPI00362CABA9
MKIGEVARRTGVATRLVRYYEQQGLLTAERAANGYRTYTDADVERVARVAGMVRAGIPTRLIKVLLDMEETAAQDRPTCTRTVADMLASELGGIEDRIACLTRSRDTIRDFLVRTEHAAMLSETVGHSTPSSTSIARAKNRSTGPSA